ncbi:putative phage tail assembly chaperone [Vibrio parahaemolyticus]|nr:hypothetical protein [Vibrio alginolyticus]EHR1162067.1 putative phage tail assembly chaperone [Vibrio parahaemolyticus]ELA9431966.1 putative phage tail assembly chaperone [Vibrio parahaemolyticus]
MKKAIILTVGGVDLSFEPTELEYNEYMNELAQGEVNGSAHNFLVNSVTEESKADLRAITDDNPGAALQICGHVLKQYTPKLEIKVKK